MVGAYVSSYSTPDNCKLLGSRGTGCSAIRCCALPYRLFLSMPSNEGCLACCFWLFLHDGSCSICGAGIYRYGYNITGNDMSSDGVFLVDSLFYDRFAN